MPESGIMNEMNRREILELGAWAALPQLPAFAQGAGWTPQAMDAHQNETLIALTDLIIPATDTPGAKAALVNRYIDLILKESPAEQRHEFLAGLSWLDGHVLASHKQPFVRLARAQQEEVLRGLDSESAPEAGRRFFRGMKSLTGRIYYATEIGFKELNKGGRVPAGFACKHPEHA